MAHFIRIDLLEDLGQMKININNVTAVSLDIGEDGRKRVTISFNDNSDIGLIENIHILDANYVFNKFPC